MVKRRFHPGSVGSLELRSQSVATWQFGLRLRVQPTIAGMGSRRPVPLGTHPTLAAFTRLLYITAILEVPDGRVFDERSVAKVGRHHCRGLAEARDHYPA